MSNRPEHQESGYKLPEPEVINGNRESSEQTTGVRSEQQQSQQLEQQSNIPANKPANTTGYGSGGSVQTATQQQDMGTQNAPQAAANDSGVPASAPQIADDVDLIEKEWVEKAKDIVAKTKQDPRAQNREMNKLKAQYLKKRYNRDIKVEDN